MERKSAVRRWAVAIGQLLLFVILMMLIVGLIFKGVHYIAPGFEDVSGYIQSVLEVASIVFAVITLAREMTETQRLEEAEFVTSLNNDFSNSEACQRVFAYAIWEGNARELALFESGKKQLDQSEAEHLRAIVAEVPEKPRQIDLSGYLTFFESIYLLLERKVITWEMVNELFKYRFFAGVHSDFVQKERLVRLPENFKNIYRLEKRWMEINGNSADQIACFENRLQAACERAGRGAAYDAIFDAQGKVDKP